MNSMLLDSLDKSKVYYLASPYSHAYDKLKNLRYEMVNKAGAVLCKRGFVIIEPIAMCHMKSLQYDLPTGYDYWMTRDRKFVSISDGGVIVLCIPGWHVSVGVTDEVRYARSLGLPVHYLMPEDVLDGKDHVNLNDMELEAKRQEMK